MTYLLICQNCPPADAPQDSWRQACDDLQSALDAAGLIDRITVTPSPCLGVCTSPNTIALQGESRASLVFKDVDLTTDRDDIIATCRAWLEADHGWIEDARPCGRLRHHLQARIPALPHPAS